MAAANERGGGGGGGPPPPPTQVLREQQLNLLGSLMSTLGRPNAAVEIC
jgi:hypothetical protein